MAENADKIKMLFSSFLSDGTKGSTPEQSSIITDGTKRAHKDTPTDGSQTSRPSRELPQDPRNRTSFYNRVDTYSPLTWFAKPLELSPLVCARYGWKNTDTDMLQCVACRAYVSGQLPKAVDAASYHESCEKLKANLVLSHEKLCTWFSSPSPESFMCLRFHNGEVDFRERLASLAQTTAALPSATYTSIDSQEVNKERVEKFCSRLQTQNGDGEKMTADGCLFALCGWSYCESQVDVLECSCCRRKVGLWNYSHVESSNTAESNGHSQPDADGPCRKRARIEKQDFDPVAEHRYWCPWLQKRSPPMVRALLEKSFVSEDRNVETNASQSSSPTARLLESPPDVKADLLQSPPGDNCESTNQEPAWLIVVKLLLGQQEVSSEEEEDLNLSRQMKMSPQLDGVHRLRRILKDCTSPSPTKVKIATSGSTD